MAIKITDFITACNKAIDRDEVIEELGIGHSTFTKYYKRLREEGKVPLLDKRVVFTVETLALLRDCFRKGYTDKEACYNCNIKYSSFTDYCTRNPDFREEKEILKRNPYNLAKNIILKQLEGNNVDIAKLVWKEDRQTERAEKVGKGILAGAWKTKDGGLNVQVNFIN